MYISGEQVLALDAELRAASRWHRTDHGAELKAQFEGSKRRRTAREAETSRQIVKTAASTLPSPIASLGESSSGDDSVELVAIRTDQRPGLALARREDSGPQKSATMPLPEPLAYSTPMPAQNASRKQPPSQPALPLSSMLAPSSSSESQWTPTRQPQVSPARIQAAGPSHPHSHPSRGPAEFVTPDPARIARPAPNMLPPRYPTVPIPGSGPGPVSETVHPAANLLANGPKVPESMRSSMLLAQAMSMGMPAPPESFILATQQSPATYRSPTHMQSPSAISKTPSARASASASAIRSSKKSGTRNTKTRKSKYALPS